jgi:hypothetical protein
MPIPAPLVPRTPHRPAPLLRSTVSSAIDHRCRRYLPLIRSIAAVFSKRERKFLALVRGWLSWCRVLIHAWLDPTWKKKGPVFGCCVAFATAATQQENQKMSDVCTCESSALLCDLCTKAWADPFDLNELGAVVQQATLGGEALSPVAVVAIATLQACVAQTDVDSLRCRLWSCCDEVSIVALLDVYRQRAADASLHPLDMLAAQLVVKCFGSRPGLASFESLAPVALDDPFGQGIRAAYLLLANTCRSLITPSLSVNMLQDFLVAKGLSTTDNAKHYASLLYVFRSCLTVRISLVPYKLTRRRLKQNAGKYLSFAGGIDADGGFIVCMTTPCFMGHSLVPLTVVGRLPDPPRIAHVAHLGAGLSREAWLWPQRRRNWDTAVEAQELITLATRRRQSPRRNRIRPCILSRPSAATSIGTRVVIAVVRAPKQCPHTIMSLAQTRW